MRWIKYILLAMTGLAVLFLLLVAIVMVTFDNDDYRRLAIRGVNYFTGYTMTIEGPFALRFLPEPSVSAEAVQLVSEAGNAAPPVTRIGKVRIRIAPWPLLRGALVVRELLVDDASMAVTIGEKGQPGAHRSAYRGKPLDITLPILESVRLHNIALDVIDDSAHRTIEVRLLQFDIDDVRDSGPLFVEGKGTLSGNEFQIEGQLGALPKIFNGAEPYPVTLAIHTAGLRVSVSGTVQDFLEGEGLALRLSGQADDLSNLFKLLKIEAPPLGELKFEALVTRDMTAPRVSALSVGLSGDTSLEFTARGAIDNAISAAGANIQFDGSCADPRVFAWLLPEVRPQPKSIQLTGELRESSGVLAAERLKLVIGDEQTAALKVTGRIASVLKAADALADGIDLMAEARDIPLPTVSDLFGLMLPDLGPINGRFKIAGSPAQLAVSKARLTTVSPQGLNISATGGISHIRLGSQKPLAGIDFSLTATAPHWAALPGAASLDLPDMGPVQIKGAVNDSSGRLDVESFEIRCETNQQAPLRLQGQILGIGSLEQMALQAAVETGSQPWVAKYLNRPSAASVPIKGSIKLAGDADGLRIDDIRFETSAGEGLAIKARGRLMRLFKSPTVELDLDISAPDPAAIASMAGVSLPPLGPLAIKGRFNSNTQKIGFSGQIHLGGSAFECVVSAAFSGARPRIDARFAAAEVHLEHIGIRPTAPAEASADISDTPSEENDQLFGDAPLGFDALNNWDLYVALAAEKLVGQDIAIENVALDIQVEKGRLRIHPAGMDYAAGFTSFDFIIDASGPTPAFDLKITGEDIDIENVLASAQVPLILGGELSVVIDLQSTGRSAREVASNLSGEFSLALENGRIRRSTNFLSADAFNLVLTTADRRQSVPLNCLVNHIQFQKGVGNIDFFLMDTPRIKTVAAGSVDLAAESIDVVINPKQKRRLLRRQGSAVRVNGPLAQPSVRLMPLAEASRLYGKLLMPQVFLSGRVLGNLWYLIRKDNETSPCVKAMLNP